MTAFRIPDAPQTVVIPDRILDELEQQPAEVLVWGDRTFQLVDAPMADSLVYREVMAFHVVLPVDHEERP